MAYVEEIKCKGANCDYSYAKKKCFTNSRSQQISFT